ncbi:MAG: ClpXP protease specificity-enhancing factor [Gammaproteobacteria bacterium]|nr:ClpXP protease specificity-enhancing factor [Gammaproteobacteria bacterium]
MTSTIPYFLRSLNEWILDNGCTPYLIVNATHPSVIVPAEHIEDGQIVLNISPQATRHLMMTNELISFSSRFGGAAYDISIPVEAVMAIIARENGEGMWFTHESVSSAGTGQGNGSEPAESAGKGSVGDGKPARGKPDLKVIK